MNIARLTDNIRTDLGDRFILYYGNVNDEFCDVDLVIGSIDFMLWRYLREQGYKRVVFFNGARNLHFYDNESRKNCLADNTKYSKDNHGNSSLKGPLGFRSLLQNASNAEKSNENLTSSSRNCSSGGVRYETRQQQSRMTDLNALDIMDHISNERGNSVPTALVFTMVEDLINFQGSSFREIQNRMIDWIRGPSDTTNICIFISQKSTLEDVQKFAEDYNLHIINNFIREKGGDHVNIIKIGFPDKTEISSTINRHRLLKGVKVDWQIFKNVTKFLERQRLPIKRLNAMFSGIGELNKETLLNWNRKKSICSTEYLIENIEKDNNLLNIDEIRKRFDTIYDQEDNIELLIDSLQSWHGLKGKRHPLSFFLVGTSGVGKSYTTELLAEALQPLGYEHCYFAMSEFMQEQTVSNLIGSPRGYVGSEEEPKLFEALKKSSKLVICFDEIEKAHEKVRVALMQLLDKGYLSWSKGEGDFRDCIIFMNSNAKKKELVEMKKKYLQADKSIDGPEFQNAVRDILTKDGFPSELCGRLNSLLVYNPLSPEAVIRIAKQEIGKLAADYGLEVGFIEPALLAEIAEKIAETEYGARPIKDNVAKELGKSLIKARKDRVNDKIAINKTDQGYSIDPASQNNKAVSDEEIIRQAETIVSTMQTESSSKSNKPDGKPKCILKLSELPTIIREALKTDASASEPTIINGVNPAVGYVEIEDFAGEQSSGSGFVITPEGIMITSFHVVENAHKIMVRFDTSPSVLFPASFIDGDKEADIALLQLEGKDFPYALLAPYGERVEIGEKVGLLGYPLGEDLGQLTTYTSGVLSSYRSLLGQGGPLLYQIDAGAYHGSSGGPLIRIRDGRVIGILAGGRKEVSQFNFAISSNEIFKRLVSEY